jgi:hypothetical protein
MIQVGAEMQVAIFTLGLSGMGVLIVQLWRLADRMARVDERLARALECCADAQRVQAQHAVELAKLGATP